MSPGHTSRFGLDARLSGRRLLKESSKHRGETRELAGVPRKHHLGRPWQKPRLNSLARALLRLAAWFGPDAMPRGIFSASRGSLACLACPRRARKNRPFRPVDCRGNEALPLGQTANGLSDKIHGVEPRPAPGRLAKSDMRRPKCSVRRAMIVSVSPSFSESGKTKMRTK
jgi:hypothetical protein